MKIYILDLQHLAKEKGHSACSPEGLVVVNTGTGVVYTKVEDHAQEKWGDNPAEYNAHHKLGTHSAPWHFAKVGPSHLQMPETGRLIAVGKQHSQAWIRQHEMRSGSAHCT